MNEWAGVFLGIMAFAAVVQCVFVVVAARGLRDSGQRISDLCRRFEAEIKPAMEDLRKGASNLRAISESGREQATRIETLLSTTLGNIEAAIERARSLIMKPIDSLNELSSVWGGLRSGLDAYRNTQVKKRSGRTKPRRSEDSDEHMFIG